MDLISKDILSKATEKIAKYEAQKREDEAFIEMQKFLEKVAVALKDKGIEELNGSNYTLVLN